jgi:hypothetical protein
LPLLVRHRQDLVWRYRALDRQLIAASATPAEFRDATVEASVRKEMAHTEASIRTLDLTLKASFPGYAALANPEPLSVAEAQAQLRDGEVLYQISIGRDKSIAWAITSGEARWQELPIGETALKDEVEALRCGLDNSVWDPEMAERMRARRDRCKVLLGREPTKWWQPPFDLGRARALYQTLFGPFEAVIANRHLLIVPSGPLTTLPLHVLVTDAPSQDDAPNEIDPLAHASWLGKRQAHYRASIGVEPEGGARRCQAEHGCQPVHRLCQSAPFRRRWHGSPGMAEAILRAGRDFAGKCGRTTGCGACSQQS